MKRVAVAVVVAFVLAASASAQAAIDSRLAGDFEVTVTPRSGGPTVYRTYSFRPLCGVGVCRKVALRRQSSWLRHYKSTLKRVEPGVYKGTEYQKGRCGDGERWRVEVKLVVKITREENDMAQAIRGRARFRVFGCINKRDRWRFYGTLG